jgi:YkoY family integral membrane protein
MDMINSDLLNDSATVITLIVLEALLSGDNALVLAIMVRHLPESQRNKALRIGLAGAFVFRALAVLVAGILIRFWQLKAIGGAYLLFLCSKYFWRRFRLGRARRAAHHKPTSFWGTVFWIEVVDLAFSIDSIMAAVGMSSKIYIVYIGGILGMISVRFIAGFVVKLLERMPALENSAYAIVGWIGIKLSMEAWLMAHGQEGEALSKWLFWPVMILIFVAGLLARAFKTKTE